MKPVTRKILFTGGGAFAVIGILAVAGGVAFGVLASGSHDRHGPLARFCDNDRLDRVASRLASIDNKVPGMTIAQRDAWKRVEADIDTGRNRLEKTCADMQATGRPDTLPEKMARVETALVGGLEALRGVRPSFEVFYETLDENQRAELDALKIGRRFHRDRHHN